MKRLLLSLLACAAVQPVFAQHASIRITSVDSTRIGGLHDFQFLINNEAQLRERFGGHDIELRFEPVWSAKIFPFIGGGRPYALYDRRIVVNDLTENRTLAEYTLVHNKLPCPTVTDLNPSEHAGIFMEDEEAPLAMPDSREKLSVTAAFTTDRECLGERRFIENAFGFSFGYTFEQWGGVIRLEDPKILQGKADTWVTTSNAGIRLVDTEEEEWQGMNNGPAVYEVEFLPGGVETMSLQYGRVASIQKKTLDVSYLNVRVHNTISYERAVSGGTTTTVSYPDEVPHFIVTSFKKSFANWPEPIDVPLGMYNLSAFAWVNSRYADGYTTDRPRQAAGPGDVENSLNKGMPVGTQGRYYLSTIADGDTVDFSHVLIASGTELVMDFANKNSRKASPLLWTKKPERPTVDFEAGDKVQFSIFGGALGFPLPDARVVIHVDTIATSVSNHSLVSGSVSVSPNPFSDNITIRYTLEHPVHVTLTVVDELGRTVAVLTDDYRAAGTHTVGLQAAEIRNGCYFYKLNAGGTVKTGMVAVIR